MRVFFFLLLLANLYTVYAQKSRAVRIGFEESINYFSLNGNSDLEPYHQPSFGFYIGLSFDIIINHNTFICTGINFTKSNTKNAEFVIDPWTKEVFVKDIKNTFHYNSVPILLCYNFDNNIYVKGGGFLNYLTRYQTESKQTHNTNILDGRIDYGISFGIGYSYVQTESINLYVELRNNLSLGHNSNLNYHTNTINFVTGWKIGI